MSKTSATLASKVGGTTVALMAFAGLVTVGTHAMFGDQSAVAGNAFDSGKVDIATSPASALVTFSGMLPGDSVTNPLVLTNEAGSAALRYAISSTATDTDSKGLKDVLTLTLKTVDVTTPGTPCDNFDGTQLYSGDLDSTAGKLVGDNAQGAQTGDRTLAVDGSETVCFKVSFPSSATGPTSAASTATFTIDAEQTTNNP